MSSINGIASAAVGTAKKANAQDAIFQDKSDLSSTDSKSGSSPPGSKSPLKPKDFYWDQMVTILVSAILGLTVLDIAVEFFRGFGVQCYTPASVHSPPAGFTRDQAAYVNDFCYQSLPPTEYYPVFIIVHGLAIVAPHYLWSSLFGGYFDFFFDLVKDLNRLRSIKTGRYDARDFEIVKKLEKEYTNRLAYYSYILKLVAQLFVALFSLLFAIFFFSDFSPNFDCPDGGISENSTSSWPLNVTVTCVYTSLRFLSVIRLVDCILIGLAVLVTVFGLLWCLFQHTKELGHQAVASFVVGSNFLQEHYVPKGFFSSAFVPRVKTDLDFLVMRLFRTDSGHGQVFKEIQVQREVEVRTREEYELLQLFWTVQIGGEPRKEDIYKTFKDAGFWGMPRLDVYRRFSPLFGISKKELCKEPLHDTELLKIAEEIATAKEVKVALLAHKLDQEMPSNGTLEEKTVSILQQWLENRRERRRAREEPQSVRVSEPLASTELQDLARWEPPESTAAPVRVDDRRDLANYMGMQEMGGDLKLTEFAVRYGTYLEAEGPEFEAFQNRIHGFLRITPRSRFAVDISFGTTGCAHILAWAFSEVVSVNFDPYLQDEPSVVKVDTFFNNVINMRLPTDIFTQKTDNVAQVEDAFVPIIYGKGDIGKENMQKSQPKSRVDFIVVGPIDNPAKRVTVTLLIDKLHTDQAIQEKAVLLAIRPLRIGSKPTYTQFTQYIPPPSLFESLSRSGCHGDQYRKLQLEIEQEVRRKAFATSEDVHGHTVYLIPTKCGDLQCLLEFSAYVYDKPQHTAAEGQQWNQSANTGNSHSSGHRHTGTTNGAPPSGSTPTNPTPTSAASGDASHGAADERPAIEEAPQERQDFTEPNNDASHSSGRHQGEHARQGSLPSLTSEEEYYMQRALGGVPASDYRPPPPPSGTESSSDTDDGMQHVSGSVPLDPQNPSRTLPHSSTEALDWGAEDTII